MASVLLPLIAGALGAEVTGISDIVPFIGPPSAGFFAGEDRPRRRRRRRMLTASDRGDIAFLTATLGKTAAKELAAVRLANL
ncbi:hypothetical protein LCGC14_2309900 [marine sediment metagenome]|uniref:Uncharacterized protein n=1 Tax=marine sediment metagenome TaxID=412755 RepID=A0A0F9CKY5_9ZZZZ